MTPQKSFTVAVTGANGFVGLSIVAKLLSSGHAVRAIARRQAGIRIINDEPSFKVHLSHGSLTTFLVKDDDDATKGYENAFKGATHVIHTAAPRLFNSDIYIEPTMKALENVRKAIELSASVTRLVVTGSISSIASWRRLLRPGDDSYLSTTATENASTLHCCTEAKDVPSSESSDEPPFQGYTSSKIKVQNYLRKYAESDRDKRFPIITILPGVIIGPNIGAKDKREAFEGSNDMLKFLFRKSLQGRWIGLDREPHPVLAEAVAISDVVDAHIRALDYDLYGAKFRSFLLSASWDPGFTWAEADDVAKALYPGNKYIQTGNASETIPEKLNCYDAEEYLLGRELKSFRVCVAEFLTWYMALPD